MTKEAAQVKTVSNQSVQDIGSTIPGRFDVLDSWRGIAAVMVVLFHVQIVGNIHDLPIVRAGETFVDFFFVLSGFVIAHAYAGRVNSGQQFVGFVVQRLGRVYPLHAVMLLLYLLFETAKAVVPSLGSAADPAFSGSNEMSAIVSNLLLVQAWGFEDGLTWNTPSWSISGELLAYLLFGAAALSFGRKLWMAAAVGAIASFAVLLLAAPKGMESTFDFGAVRALYGFCLGVLLHRAIIAGVMRTREELRREPSQAARLAWTIAELAAIGCIVAYVGASHQNAAAFAAPLVFAFAINVFAHEGGHVSRLLRWRPFLTVGMLSYSIYMIHMFVLLRCLNVGRLADKVLGTEILRPMDGNAAHGLVIDFGNRFAGDLAIVGVLGVIVAISYVTYRVIERPGQQAFRRLARRMTDRRDERLGTVAIRTA
ncbi:acyltransferase family protein [Aquibium oceanicum]|uniref:Acyltransferase 3 domain-containing protein n=1 Tax=Aquibium oceanicum TaxID=1670800 RepID=A0A1L3SQZ5_9HYPH|nr:acyltransferase [Aquibium oceanicum]APH71843.1 hypothetical protein BSQ44_11025 [Aquibium oceanicum]